MTHSCDFNVNHQYFVTGWLSYNGLESITTNRLPGEAMRYRIQKHPILEIPERVSISFTWQKKNLSCFEGETIAAALLANGIQIFGHHPKDHSPQGLFCANGQCSQCLVLANRRPVKACMELVTSGMQVEPLDTLPDLPLSERPAQSSAIPVHHTSVLILGGGPAGLAAAIELGRHGVDAILVDDKPNLGGKLVLQTHRFFGSHQAVDAGTRGIEIAHKLANELMHYPGITTWTNTTALAVFSDKKIGILKNWRQYHLVEPKVLLVATGAREKFLAFPGNTLPGVYGAGAFQTLVNRDLVRPSGKLFVVGGGNVGLIAAYHALQAGIEVVGLAEALPEVSGYKVHRDKLARLGVPIYTSHTIVQANGREHVESVTITAVDSTFTPIKASERSFACDSLLVAVGLEPVNDFLEKAREFGLPAYAAGDANEIAEASAAIFSGKIAGLEIARREMRVSVSVPAEWNRTEQILKSKPGKIYPHDDQEPDALVYPVLHCDQEIPCDPCSYLCDSGLISVDPEDIRSVPTVRLDQGTCRYCLRCVVGCPGLAITVVDRRRLPNTPRVALAYEFDTEDLHKGDKVIVVDCEGVPLSEATLEAITKSRTANHTAVVHLRVPSEYAHRAAGFRKQTLDQTHRSPTVQARLPDEAMVCRCERVSAGEIRALIREGVRDLNEIKAVTRAGMGACGSKTCSSLILSLFRQEGVPLSAVTLNTRRPLAMEVPIGVFAGENAGDETTE